MLETSISGAQNVLLNITGGSEFSLVDMGEVSGIVRDMVSEEANIIVGTAMDDNLKDEIKVTLIATGLNGGRRADEARNSRYSSAGTSSSNTNRQPTTFSTSFDDDSIFNRKLRPGMGSIDVPNFFKQDK